MNIIGIYITLLSNMSQWHLYIGQTNDYSIPAIVNGKMMYVAALTGALRFSLVNDGLFSKLWISEYK